jgi:SAM-dependent methyltransferase
MGISVEDASALEPASVVLESPPCLVCGASNFEMELDGVTDLVWKKPGVFAIQRCASCGLVMTRPRPTPASLGFYYAGAYSGGDAVDMAGFYEGPLGRALNHYRVITIEKVRKLLPSDRVLDVGCSQGFFLQVARERTGCQTAGIDLDEGSIAAGLARGRAELLQVGTLETVSVPPESQDVVTFYQCLEHDPDPVATLRRARAALRPGGLVVVEVPNWNTPWRMILGRRWMPLLIPQHLVHFGPTTLNQALSAAGLEPIHHQTMLFPIELVTSLGLWFEALLPAKTSGLGKVLHAVLRFVLLLVFWTIEVPAAFWMRVFRCAGHQTAIARKAPWDGRPSTGETPDP